MSFLIFSDLDDTLLDHETYSFEKALPALKEVKRRGIPLILVSSKTRAEIEMIRQRLDNHDPFIVENGGGIFFPKKAPDSLPPKEGKELVSLGVSYEHLRKALKAFREEKGVRIRGFGDMSAEECAQFCGFSVEEAVLAKQREFDEPFLLDGPCEFSEMEAFFAGWGLSLVRGGRFFHLKGKGCNKGKAVKNVITRFEEETMAPWVTVGLGDSANDREMLEAVERPVVVKRSDGSYAPELIGLPRVILAPAVGPVGWSQVVLEVIGCPAPPHP